jgi:DNA polymerase III epsilon subunit-like protein
MIVFDLETDGLLGPSALPLEDQPKILEIGALALHAGTLQEVDRFHVLLDSGRPIPDVVTERTGISDKMVRGKPLFSEIYSDLVKFFFGHVELIAHNLAFDRGVLAGELQRMGKLLEFPWPPKHICTVERTEHFENKSLKQEYIYEKIHGEAANQTHRALDDALQLATIVRWMHSPTPIEGWDLEPGENLL